MAKDVKPGLVNFCIRKVPDGKCKYFFIFTPCLFTFIDFVSLMGVPPLPYHMNIFCTVCTLP
jgi:hypothetical protein